MIDTGDLNFRFLDSFFDNGDFIEVAAGQRCNAHVG
jgi:hypothetical protein